MKWKIFPLIVLFLGSACATAPTYTWDDWLKDCLPGAQDRQYCYEVYRANKLDQQAEESRRAAAIQATVQMMDQQQYAIPQQQRTVCVESVRGIVQCFAR